MGRGQQTVSRHGISDHFSHIFGNRRGARHTEEETSSTPERTVSPSPDRIVVGDYLFAIFDPTAFSDPEAGASVRMYRVKTPSEAEIPLADLRKLSPTFKNGLKPLSFDMQAAVEADPNFVFQWIGSHRFSNLEFRSVWAWVIAQREAHPDW